MVAAPTAAAGRQVLASLVPQARPALAADIVRVAARLPQPAPDGGLGGALCGDPAIKGALIAPIVAAAPGCGLADGVKVTSVAGVRLSQPAIVDCQTARSLRGWVQMSVIPAIGQRGGGLAGLDIADSYACRPRNNQAGNKISEHGKGHAVDIAGFTLRNGTEITVLQDWGTFRAGAILAAMRRAACGPFTTILGPGSDRFHRNHFHLDTARGRNPYCH